MHMHEDWTSDTVTITMDLHNHTPTYRKICDFSLNSATTYFARSAPRCVLGMFDFFVSQTNCYRFSISAYIESLSSYCIWMHVAHCVPINEYTHWLTQILYIDWFDRNRICSRNFLSDVWSWDHTSIRICELRQLNWDDNAQSVRNKIKPQK